MDVHVVVPCQTQGCTERYCAWIHQQHLVQINTSHFSVIYNYVGHNQMFQDDVQVAYCCSYVQLLNTACGSQSQTEFQLIT